VAVVVVFLFLFSASGAVNQVIGALGIDGPNWFADPRGVLHVLLGGLGVGEAPAALADHGFIGISWWEWVAGPSVAMSALILLAVFTTSGTFVLLFLAGLQDISAEVEEAALVDGASSFQRLRHVTVQANQYPLKLAAAALMTIPVAVLFFVVQRQVMAGTEGAVEE